MARKQNFAIDQGTDAIVTLNITDSNGTVVDVSAYTGQAWMKKTYTSANYYAFEVETSANGNVTLTMSAENTANVPAGRYVYDCLLTSSSGIVSRILEGIVDVTPKVTG